jgi:hypothetical protein
MGASWAVLKHANGGARPDELRPRTMVFARTTGGATKANIQSLHQNLLRDGLIDMSFPRHSERRDLG